MRLQAAYLREERLSPVSLGVCAIRFLQCRAIAAPQPSAVRLGAGRMPHNGPARTREARPSTDMFAGRPRSLCQGQRAEVRLAPHRRRTKRPKDAALSRRHDRVAIQPRAETDARSTQGRRQASQGCVHRRRSPPPHDPKRHDQERNNLGIRRMRNT